VVLHNENFMSVKSFIVLWLQAVHIDKDVEEFHIQNYNIAYGSVWAWNLVSNIKGGT
jgi:hypothetical protein